MQAVNLAVELSTESYRSRPPRCSEPESSRSQGRGRFSGACGVCGQVDVYRRPIPSSTCERYDRPVPGEPLVPSEGAIVTSKRSGVVTRAAIPLTARFYGGILG